jgi:hypothetical protein
MTLMAPRVQWGHRYTNLTSLLDIEGELHVGFASQNDDGHLRPFTLEITDNVATLHPLPIKLEVEQDEVDVEVLLECARNRIRTLFEKECESFQSGVALFRKKDRVKLNFWPSRPYALNSISR